MNKNIILAGAVAIGIYLFSQAKKIPFITGAQRSPSATTQTIRQRTAQKVAQRIAQKVAQKVVPKNIYEYMHERARMNRAIPISSKKIARKIPSVGTSAARRRMAQKIEETRNRKMREQMAAKQRAVVAQQEAAARKAAAQRAAAQKIKAQRAAPWKAPYRFPNKKFRVITPSDLLKNLAKKDIARKKALRQKKAQKTTHSTPSDRRKSRLKALYGLHWHDIWVKRQKR